MKVRPQARGADDVRHLGCWEKTDDKVKWIRRLAGRLLRCGNKVRPRKQKAKSSSRVSVRAATFNFIFGPTS